MEYVDFYWNDLNIGKLLFTCDLLLQVRQAGMDDRNIVKLCIVQTDVSLSRESVASQQDQKAVKLFLIQQSPTQGEA